MYAEISISEDDGSADVAVLFSHSAEGSNILRVAVLDDNEEQLVGQADEGTAFAIIHGRPDFFDSQLIDNFMLLVGGCLRLFL